jgi:hypothetical protein
MITSILDMFTYCRPMGSKTEQKFINRFLAPLGFKRDKHQNLILKVGNKPRILFSSHVDTVHKKEGKQALFLKSGILTSDGSCLGADDTAGIWLMTEMVKADVPGLYVIHHGEESGCIGSSAIAAESPEVLNGIDIAIAFDRMGYADIITHQMWRRTASDAFARSLATELGGSYAPSDEGAYTDTNEYSHIVPECTNISVGYLNQHTGRESQDVTFLMALREALLQVNWDNLVVARDPHKLEDDQGFFGGRSRRGRNSRGFDLEDLIADYPDVAADILRAMGVDEAEFARNVEDYYGVCVAA